MRMRPLTLIVALLAWMVIVVCVLGLILLSLPHPDTYPRRQLDPTAQPGPTAESRRR
jgi:hypothetical protein